MRLNLNFLFILLALCMAGYSFAQEAPENQYVDEGDVIELEDVDVRVKIEAPQVRMISDRIKPEFDEVHLEKSFTKEIVGAGQSFEIKNVKNKNISVRINIDDMLKKIR